MPLIPEFQDDLLIIHSRGDHSVEEGIRQLDEAMALARERSGKTGIRYHLLFDMLESQEAKSAGELQGLASYFAPHMGHLSGRMAVHVAQSFHFGLTRLFAAYSESRGMEVRPFYQKDEALRWLRDDDPAAK